MASKEIAVVLGALTFVLAYATLLILGVLLGLGRVRDPSLQLASALGEPLLAALAAGLAATVAVSPRAASPTRTFLYAALGAVPLSAANASGWFQGILLPVALPLSIVLVPYGIFRSFGSK